MNLVEWLIYVAALDIERRATRRDVRSSAVIRAASDVAYEFVIQQRAIQAASSGSWYGDA